MIPIVFLLAVPVLIGLGLLFFPLSRTHSLSVIAMIALLVPLYVGVYRMEDAFLAIPTLFEASWQFHSYTLIGGAAFVLLGAVILLFVGPVMNRWQLAAFCIAITSTLGITLAASYMSLFILWEFLTASAAVLILADGESSRGIGSRFLMTHLVAGLSLLFGILIHFNNVGSLALAPPSGLASLLIMLGVGTKAALFPLHFWLPATYPIVSPAATVALSVLTTKAGIFALARIFPASTVIAYIGGTMALYGVYMALQQTKMRQLLSYHIISQLGYMVASLGIGGASGINGGLLHMLNHMVYKSLLLMIAASVIWMYGTDELSHGSRKPWWLTAMAIAASFAIIGLPPFNGYVSKSIIKYATQGSYLQFVLLIASIGTAVSFGKFLYFGFLRRQRKSQGKAHPLPRECIFAMAILALMTIVLGVSTSLIGQLLPHGYKSVYTTGGMVTSLQLAVGGFLVFWFSRALLDPAKHRVHSTSKRSMIPVRFTKNMAVGINRLEATISQLNNAQYLVATMTMIILLSLMFFTLR